MCVSEFVVCSEIMSYSFSPYFLCFFVWLWIVALKNFTFVYYIHKYHHFNFIRQLPLRFVTLTYSCQYVACV